MSKKDKMTMRKVSLISLIDLLKQIYDEGADYIDIEGEQTDGEEDMLKITVRPEYFTEIESNEDDPDYVVTEMDYEEEINPIKEDDDINDLI
jgi:hypothetical protein|tara:strand:- start:3734 stop:4009 length:276 start_codon:yes stop_codon:yes gene_type:complete